MTPFYASIYLELSLRIVGFFIGVNMGKKARARADRIGKLMLDEINKTKIPKRKKSVIAVIAAIKGNHATN